MNVKDFPNPELLGSFMQSKHLIGLLHIWTKGQVGVPWNRFKPSSEIFFTDSSKVVLLLWIIYVISVLFLLFLCEHLSIDALWSPAGKGLSSWLSFAMSHCEVVTFPLVSWVSCGDWLYQFLIFVPFLTLSLKVKLFLFFCNALA